MTRGTTPTITLRISGYDLTQNTNYVTITQDDGTSLTTTDGVVSYENEVSTISIYLTQEQTLMFSKKKNSADIQLRTIDSEGTALASKIYHFSVHQILLDGEIEYA